MLQAVILDFDGTISPTNERQYNWFRSWAEQNGKELASGKGAFKSIDEFMTFYNEQIHEGGPQKVYDRLGLPCDMNDKGHPVWAAYEAFKNDNPSGFYEGMKEAIHDIWELGHLSEDTGRNRRLRLAINTNNTWKSIRKELVRENVLQCFDAFVTEEVLSEYHGAGNPDAIKKPAKISLALTLGYVGSEAGSTLHVGDTLNDLRGSQKVRNLGFDPASLVTVGACYGYEGREKLAAGAEAPSGVVYFDHLIDDPRELVGIVKELL